ncbi:MAG: potassium transporter [Gammaproteobacteria bacterium]|nr:MAG: potassium transporter [Gammaproteobacteria bacterium]
MHFRSVQRILGILLMLFSVTLVPPLLVAWISADGAVMAFLVALGIILASGLAIWLPVAGHRRELRVRDGFVVVVMFWTVLTLIGALPFVLAEHPHLPLIDAIFESASGLTTTGATVIVGLDEQPVSILYYRQQLQWLGGMGIVVLAVAVLPMLGIGGMQLYRAETPGPIKDNKLTPRLAETAKALWYIYLGLTVACGLAYWAAGMSPFDALGHAFSTVAIGGFSTHDASLGYFQSPLVDGVAVLFMFLAGINFSLHFVAFRSRNPAGYWHDPELRFYVLLLVVVAALTVVGLYWSGTYESWEEALQKGIFHAVSIGTTTGFTTDPWHVWPGFLVILLLFASTAGGCAGSTGGGLKVIRVLLLIKQGLREIRRLIHPNAQIPVRLGDKVVASRVIEAVWGFFALYVASFTVMYLALAASGVDLMTAFSAVMACLNNLGPGLENVGPHYADMPDLGKGILVFAMLLGRLEIFTLLVLLTPAFWRD